MLAVVMLITVTGIPTECAAAQRSNILILNSYHVGYRWSDDTYRGILDTLQPQLDSVALHVEYLDMKRHYSELRYDQLATALHTKYAEVPIDLVISTDDAAFIFLSRYRDELFPGVPVFFCGTNYLERETLANLPLFFGITEEADIEATLLSILDLLPDTEQVFVINDTTVTGRNVDRQIRQAIDKLSHSLSFTVWDDISMPDIITRVSELPENSVIFYTFFFRDNSGQNFEYDQSIGLIHRQSPVPVFGAWDFNLGLGIVGGMLTSGYQQGAAAARLALTRIDGADFDRIPRLSSSPNRFMFDYTQLDRWQISMADLPHDAIIINRPETFFEKHRKVLTISGMFICILLVVIVILTLNISLRKRAEQELRQSESNFRGIFNNAREGLYQSTAEGCFIRVNPALASMLKCESPEEVLTHYTNINNQLYGCPQEKETPFAEEKHEGWVKREHQIICRDGSKIDVIESMHAVVDERGRFLYFEGSFIDMTDYKKTQELVAQTDKMLSLGGVSAGIAHEIRSPLSSIVLGMQVVRGRLEENQPDNLETAQNLGTSITSIHEYLEQREILKLLRDINDSAIRAGVIIDDMLSFGKKSIGDFSHHPLADIVISAVSLARKDQNLIHECNFRMVKIIEDFSNQTPDVYCSASKIQQVCFNILKNGAEAMADNNGIAPEFHLRIRPKGNMVLLEIEDNGPGMDKELQSRIFEPFYTTKGRAKGTGLGLSVSYFIIKENHRGDLLVSSEPGKGTTFSILLPTEPPDITMVPG